MILLIYFLYRLRAIAAVTVGYTGSYWCTCGTPVVFVFFPYCIYVLGFIKHIFNFTSVVV